MNCSLCPFKDVPPEGVKISAGMKASFLSPLHHQPKHGWRPNGCPGENGRVSDSAMLLIGVAFGLAPHAPAVEQNVAGGTEFTPTLLGARPMAAS